MPATVGGLQRSATARLARTSDSPALDARWLIGHALGVDDAWLIIHARDPLDASEIAAIDALVERRAAGEPLAYIVGRTGFHAVELAVTPDVLIPRPDTETLVTQVLEQAGDRDRLQLVDLGTGSGAIALALAAARPTWSILASDSSAEALACARANAAALGLAHIRFARGDWFDAIDDGVFDWIVSNPPYVAVDDPHLEALGHEPRAALVAGHDGLADIAHLIAHAPPRLVADGRLALEHGADQGAAVRALFEAEGYHGVATCRDLAGRERVTVGRRPGPERNDI